MMGKHGCPVHMVSFWLVFVGALNWGLVGALEFNLVDYLLGSWPVVAKAVYILVGLAAIMMLFKGKCKKCKDSMCKACGGSGMAGGSSM